MTLLAGIQLEANFQQFHNLLNALKTSDVPAVPKKYSPKESC